MNLNTKGRVLGVVEKSSETEHKRACVRGGGTVELNTKGHVFGAEGQ